MNFTQYVKIIFCILWNIIVFPCPVIAPQNLIIGKKKAFSAFARIDTYFYNIFFFLKQLKNKIIINKNNKADAASAQTGNKNKKQILNILNTNNKVLNKALKLSKLLSYLKLKDAQATQNLISKQHIFPIAHKLVTYRVLMFRLDLNYIKAYIDAIRKVTTVTQDKCAYLSPFAVQNYRCSELFLIFT